MILKKGCFAEIEIQEIYEQVKSVKYEQDPLTRIETLKTEVQELFNQTETSNTEQVNTPDSNTTNEINGNSRRQNKCRVCVWHKNASDGHSEILKFSVQGSVLKISWLYNSLFFSFIVSHTQDCNNGHLRSF